MMSFMRDLESRLRKDKERIEDDIPFWEFIDLEFDKNNRIFHLTAYYTQKPSFPELFRRLIGSKKDANSARTTLATIVVPPPKRPIYYCQYEMQFLPYKSRDILRDMGDFVDMLVKAAVYERTSSVEVFDSTLAQAINQFEKHLSSHPKLTRWLREYNQFLYSPKPASERVRYTNQHRFTVRETVLVIFVAMHLADKITAISRMAELVRQDKPMRTDSINRYN